MWCMKCNKDLVKCDCPDIDERLKELSKSEFAKHAVIPVIMKRKLENQKN